MAKLDKTAALKILKGAGIAGGGAALTYAIQALGSFEFGSATPIVTAALAVAINFVRKWFGNAQN